jgi:hypothetical protein
MVVLAAIVVATAVPVSSSIPWATIIEVLAALVTVGGAALWAWTQAKTQRLRNDRFDRDWYGETERPGVPARPGVLEQLYTVRTEVGEIKAEVFPNHGSSIKDSVDRMDLRLKTVELDIKGIHEKLDGKQPDVHA